MGMQVFNINNHKNDFQNKKKDGLTKNWLEECIVTMGNDNVIFQNECQFQFALAWAIKEFFGYEISLEEVTLIDVFKNKKRRSYTDIVIQTDENKYIAIELKYKTAKTNSSGEQEDYGEGGLTQQGAQGFGKYDFLWDVNRNEFLIYGDKKIDQEKKILEESNKLRLSEQDVQSCSILKADKKLEIPQKTIQSKKFSSAFSIFLTNDDTYYTYPKRKASQDFDFRLAEKDSKLRVFKAEKEYCWGIGTSKKVKGTQKTYSKNVILSDDIRGKARGRILSFLQNYTCEWKDYKKEANSFKFLILETKNNP